MIQLSFAKISHYILSLSVVLITFIAPISIFIHTIMILSVIDLITAITRDMRLRKKDKIKVIESKKIRKTVTKLIMYILFIISSFLLMQVTFGATFYIPNVVFGMLALVEVVSIGENMATITGNNIFIKITKRITNIVTKKIDAIFE